MSGDSPDALRTAIPYVVHDLANLLTCIVAAASTGIRSPDERYASLVAIDAAAARGVELLALLRRTTTRIDHRAPVRDIVASCAVLLDHVGRRSCVSVTASAAPALVAALPAYELQEIVLNLGINAIEAMPHGGRVHIEARALDGELHLVVEDDGPGIDATRLATLFAKPTSTKHGHDGLGLHAVQTIAARAGGRVAVDRTATRGSRFIVNLPLA